MKIPNQNSGLFRRTPPAIFPPIFGLFGLGLAWRRAADGFSVTPALGNAILGAVSLLYLFALSAYVVKVVRRPGVIGEDLKTLPGRAGLAALTLSGMLFAATLVIYSTKAALVVLVLAAVLHLGLFAMVLRALISGPREARRVTPVWHLIFVGFILSPLSALPLGFTLYSQAIFAGTFVLALAIWAASLVALATNGTPAPLRPTLAIHLAPASVLGTVAYLLGYAGLGFALGILAMLILATLLLRLRWLTAAGFSPFWGAFTFPIAAFSTLMQIIAATGQGEVFRILGGVALVAATLIIPFITWKIMQMWMKGVLAVKTNAAEA